MPEEQEKPSLHIDTDWKRQAQEEKRRLAEQEKQKAQAASSAATATATATAPEAGAPEPGRAPRDPAPASFASLVSSVMTQALFYLGELAPRGGEPIINLDAAKHHIDTLGILEEKTRGNLTAEEQKLLDTALYNLRMRYVSAASQFIS